MATSAAGFTVIGMLCYRFLLSCPLAACHELSGNARKLHKTTVTVATVEA